MNVDIICKDLSDSNRLRFVKMLTSERSADASFLKLLILYNSQPCLTI